MFTQCAVYMLSKYSLIYGLEKCKTIIEFHAVEENTSYRGLILLNKNLKEKFEWVEVCGKNKKGKETVDVECNKSFKFYFISM